MGRLTAKTLTGVTREAVSRAGGTLSLPAGGVETGVGSDWAVVEALTPKEGVTALAGGAGAVVGAG